ncbi:MAG: glycine betaine ABC transporter substrate-binding protein [Coriobacteriia bacterium]|nr:glycine betaine ABC transporter substrate-binding protein [Coriobacteriia bacterium]
MNRSRLALTALVLGTLLLSACAAPATTAETPKTPTVKAGPEVKFGSYVDSEGQVVGAAIVQLLEANGIKVVDKTKFGTPDVVRKAYLQGDLDGAIDYTGSGAFYVGPEGDPLWSDAAKGYETVKTKDLAQNRIVWLTPAPANNTESIAVKKDFSEKNNIKTLEDLAAYVNKGGVVKLIGAQAWIDNPYGVKGYQKAYGFTLKKDQIIGLSDGNTAQFIKALANGTDDVNFAEVYATDGGLADLGLVVLADSKSVPPVYNPAPVFREAIITAYPEIPGIIDPLFKTLTIENLQQLNKAVAIDGKDPKVVAKEYLTANGLLK